MIVFEKVKKPTTEIVLPITIEPLEAPEHIIDEKVTIFFISKLM